MTAVSKHSYFRARSWAALFWSAGAAAFVACSGQDTSDVAPALQPETVNPAPTALDPDQMEAEFQARAAGSLSDEERAAVEARLRDSGVDMSRVRFAGRLAVLDDIYISVEDLLPTVPAEGGVTEKGRVFDKASDTSNVPAPDSTAAAITANTTVRFANTANGHVFFVRPDVSGVMVVLPNSAPSFLVSGFSQAATAIGNAASDCLASASIFVQTRAQFDAMSATDRTPYKFIFVNYAPGASACPDDPSAQACSQFPRDQSREFDVGLSTTRLVPGARIGVNSNQITASNPRLDSLTHELMHALGIPHPNDFIDYAVVPGTSCSNKVFSIMQSERNGANPYRSRSLTADDKATIGALYSGGCGYTDTPRDLGASVASCTGADGCSTQCTRISVSEDLRGECCFCNGKEKTYVRSASNAITYFCQGV